MSRTIFAFFVTASLGCGAVPLLQFPASLTSAQIHAAATDRAGNVYVTGVTYLDSFAGAVKNKFPATSGSFQTVWGSRNCVPPSFWQGLSCMDAFVAKFSPTGQLVYASYLGGTQDDGGMAIAVDTNGNAWVAGYTLSNDFPITANALQKKNAGGTLFVSPTNPPPFQGDAFVAEVNPTGTALIYSSFLGGTAADTASLIAIDAQGNIILAGETYSSDFPVTIAGPHQSAFVVRLNPAMTSMVYSTYFEVPITGLTVDPGGSAYLAGSTLSSQLTTTPGAFQRLAAGDGDAYVAKLNPDGTRAFATLLGGSGLDGAESITVDQSGSIWLAGNTNSADFPGAPPSAGQRRTIFVARFSADGSSLVLAFLINPSLSMSPQSFLQDPAGNIYITGDHYDLSPVDPTPDALEKSSCDPTGAIITKWSPQGERLYISYSREGTPIAMDSSGRLYFVQGFGGIVRLDPSADQRQGSLACLTNGGSFVRDTGGISPGEALSLFGDRLGPDQPAQMQFDAAGKLSTNIGNTRVLFNGVPGPMLYAGTNQINVLAPWNLPPGQNLAITVEYAGVNSLPLLNYSNTSTPAVFMAQPPTYPPGQGAILNQDGTINSSSNPAQRGSIISIFCTGMGLLSPVPQDGEIIQDTTHLLQVSVPILFPGATGLTEAQIIYEGAAPTLVAGVTQVNVQLPDTFPVSVTLPGPVPIYMHIPYGPITPVLATVAVK